MATSKAEIVDREVLERRGPVFGASAVLLAGLVVGVASFDGGATAGFDRRLPIYVLAGTVLFVGALLALRYSPRDRMTVLRRATGAGFLGSVFTGLWSEAVVYGLILTAPELSVYLAAAAVLTCGLAYWSLRNWHAVNDLTRPW